MPPIGRRTVLKLASVSAALAAVPWSAEARTARSPSATAVASDDLLSIRYDARLHTALARTGDALTPFQPSESLLLPDGGALDAFEFVDERIDTVSHPRHGTGHQHVVRGRSADGIEKTVEVTFYGRYPGMAILATTYSNVGHAPLEVAGWRNAAYELADAPGGFWSFSGATHEDRRDWVQPVDTDFNQRNTLAMAASDYGGGTPMANLWGRDGGVAVGHIETVPRLLDMPVRKTSKGASIAIESTQAATLQPGDTLTTDRTLLCMHRGDFYAPLDLYRQFMQDQGIASRDVPESAFAPIWCAWGYERDFTTEQVLATLPKARELGFEWAVLDDGWQTNEGDWAIDRRKFPRGDADMRAFTDAVREQGMRPRLWLAPLAADPGSDVLHQHPDMLLLDEWGGFQKVTWWNALTQCPAYQKTIDYYAAFVKKAIGEWGFEGLKLDGQHLNAVAPCHNPAHNHAHPNESCEKMPDFWNAIHAAAREANPAAVVELCPCGTAFAFHNLPATDQFPSSDPLSSWQIRHKGKSVKALMGRGSSYAGDHVELSTGGQDFATSVGIGAVISTKFTWPRDTERPNPGPLPPGGFVLTQEKEALWRKWVDLYKAHMLPRGEYLGALYDIGFDKPEAHAIAKDGAMYYAFYADDWNGTLQLRGLGKGRWRVRDLFNDTELGIVDSRANTLPAAFEGFLLLQATPEGGEA